jgi:hypothetical protein
MKFNHGIFFLNVNATNYFIKNEENKMEKSQLRFTMVKDFSQGLRVCFVSLLLHFG